MYAQLPRTVHCVPAIIHIDDWYWRNVFFLTKNISWRKLLEQSMLYTKLLFLLINEK